MRIGETRSASFEITTASLEQDSFQGLLERWHWEVYGRTFRGDGMNFVDLRIGQLVGSRSGVEFEQATKDASARLTARRDWFVKPRPGDCSTRQRLLPLVCLIRLSATSSVTKCD